MIALRRIFAGKLGPAAPAQHGDAPLVQAIGLPHGFGLTGFMAERGQRRGFEDFAADGTPDGLRARLGAGRGLILLHLARRVRLLGEGFSCGDFAADGAELRPGSFRCTRRFASCFPVAGDVARGNDFTRGGLAANGASLHFCSRLGTCRLAFCLPFTG